MFGLSAVALAKAGCFFFTFQHSAPCNYSAILLKSVLSGGSKPPEGLHFGEFYFGNKSFRSGGKIISEKLKQPLIRFNLFFQIKCLLNN
ncbi:MAG: hypothetical protein DYG98_21770 [Haliscomenobacteraceae bacterium CHB4]|nr:hypothetical protein [Haliscomenobacteraceae bacterium CHB4]